MTFLGGKREQEQEQEQENQSSESRWTLGNKWKWPGTLIVAAAGGEETGKKCRSRKSRKAVREGADVDGWEGRAGGEGAGYGLQKGESAK